jgi:hypothetical protein
MPVKKKQSGGNVRGSDMSKKELKSPKQKKGSGGFPRK